MITKTKIIATVGPASSDVDMLSELINHGVDVFRLNFSHGGRDDHERLFGVIDKARRRFNRSIAIMGDLCGPKIRTGKIVNTGEIVEKGEKVIINNDVQKGNVRLFGTNYECFSDDVDVGEKILINDGLVELEVREVVDGDVICKVIVGGEISSHKGINLPESQISSPAITDYDWNCAGWAIEKDFDYLALSFVRKAAEIVALKEFLSEKGSAIKVVSKIEKPEAVENLEGIITVSDSVLVARGDLGVEMDMAKVPLIQKRITHICRELGRPVVVATQMLESMIIHARATRAETSDVANAIMDLTDAVMLSGETAIGSFPVKSVEGMERIARVTEEFLDDSGYGRVKIKTSEDLVTAEALARNIASLVDDLDVKLVVVWSQSGKTARLLSKSRIEAPVIAFSENELTSRQMNMHYGVIPVRWSMPEDLKSFLDLIDELVISNRWCEVGERVIVLPSKELETEGSSHSIHFHRISGS